MRSLRLFAPWFERDRVLEGCDVFCEGAIASSHRWIEFCQGAIGVVKVRSYRVIGGLSFVSVRLGW